MTKTVSQVQMPAPAKTQVIDGQPSELRGVKYVFVWADKNLPARNEIVQRLNEAGLQTVSDSRQADLGIFLTIQYTQQGRLVEANMFGQAFRPNPSGGVRRVWTYDDRQVRRSIKEQDVAKAFVKEFLNAYKRANR